MSLLDSFYEDTSTPVAPPAPAAPAAAPEAPAAPAVDGSRIKQALDFASKEFGVDRGVLAGMMMRESGGDPSAVGPETGDGQPAIGLMQFKPGTAKRYGIDPTDPVQSIIGAAAYLKDNLKKFDGNYAKAIAGYNWGENRKAFDQTNWQAALPKETKDYLAFVSEFAQRLGSKTSFNPSSSNSEPRAMPLPDGVTPEPAAAGAGRGLGYLHQEGAAAIPGQEYRDPAGAVPPPAERPLNERIKDYTDAALNVGTSWTTSMLGQAGGLIGATAGIAHQAITGGTQAPGGTEQAVQEGGEKLTFTPRTERGQELAETANSAISDAITPIMPLTPELAGMHQSAAPIKQAAGDVFRSAVSRDPAAPVAPAAGMSAADQMRAARKLVDDNQPAGAPPRVDPEVQKAAAADDLASAGTVDDAISAANELATRPGDDVNAAIDRINTPDYEAADNARLEKLREAVDTHADLNAEALKQANETQRAIAEARVKDQLNEIQPNARTESHSELANPEVGTTPTMRARDAGPLETEARRSAAREQAGLPPAPTELGQPGLADTVPSRPAPVDPRTAPFVDLTPMDARQARQRLLVMRDQLRIAGGDPNSLVAAPHPSQKGAFAIKSLDRPEKLQPLPDAPARAAAPSTDPVDLYVAAKRKENTPAARAFVQDFDAGRVTPEDVRSNIARERAGAAGDSDINARSAGLNETGRPSNRMIQSEEPVKARGTGAERDAAIDRPLREGPVDEAAKAPENRPNDLPPIEPSRLPEPESAGRGAGPTDVGGRGAEPARAGSGDTAPAGGRVPGESAGAEPAAGGEGPRKGLTDYAPDLGEQHRVDALNSALNRKVKGGGVDYRAVKAPEKREDMHSAQALTQSLFGKKIIWVKSANGREVFNGARFSATPDHIYVNVENQRPIMAVVGHEMLHALRGDAPHLYDALLKRTGVMIDGHDAHAQHLNERYASQGLPKLSRDVTREEMMADIAGNHWMEPDFIRALGEGRPQAFRPIVARVIAFLDKVLSKLGAHDVFRSNQYIRDIQGVREAYVKAFRDYGDSIQPPSLRTSTAEGEVRFNARDEEAPADKLSPEAEKGASAPAPRAVQQAQGLANRARGAWEDVRQGLLNSVLPMSTGSKIAQAVVKKYANAERLARYQWQQFDRILKTHYTPEQLEKMWTAADQENLVRSEGRVAGENEGLNSLTPDERATVETLHLYGEELLQRAKDAGMFKGEGLPYWTPRIAVMIDKEGGYFRPKDSTTVGRNVTTTAPSLKQRKYLRAEDTEQAMQQALGDDARIARNIRAMPLAMARLERAVAGRELVNSIQEIGDRVGQTFVSENPGKDFAQVRVAGIAGGHMYVAKEFEGPLKSILYDPGIAPYRWLMAIKQQATSLIMYSPMIHNMVILGKALPAVNFNLPKLLMLYNDGYKLRTGRTAGYGSAIVDTVAGRSQRESLQNPMVNEAISNGLVPFSSHDGGRQDIVGVMEDSSLAPGQGMKSKLIGGAVGLVNKRAGEATKVGLDNVGHFVHRTLLWDRIADLQMGLYADARQNLTAAYLKKGWSQAEADAAAGKTAAHLANRYTGALPGEAMSQGARQLANVALFSRSFTLGNIALFKDALHGLPSEVRAQLEAEVGPAKANAANSVYRRKAIGTLLLDIGAMYVINSLAQDAMDHWLRDKGGDEIVQGYKQRFAANMRQLSDNPMSVMPGTGHPLEFLHHFFSNGMNEPGKEARIRGPSLSDGTATYFRSPLGKTGEDLEGWAGDGFKTLWRKTGTIVKPAIEIGMQGLGSPIDGRRIWAPSDTFLQAAGKALVHVVKAQVPFDDVSTVSDLATGGGKGTEEQNDLKQKKMILPVLGGVTVSKGYPGGPANGILHEVERTKAEEKSTVLPEVNKLLKTGDDADRDQAIEIMREKLQMTPAEIKRQVNMQTSPMSRFNPARMKRDAPFMTDAQKEKLDAARDER